MSDHADLIAEARAFAANPMKPGDRICEGAVGVDVAELLGRLADALSFAGDRDRAAAERAWDDCAFQWAMYKSGPTPVNPYRESEARND